MAQRAVERARRTREVVARRRPARFLSPSLWYNVLIKQAFLNMASHVSHHVLYRIANTPINTHPFPHIYVRDVFPEDFYRELRAHLPPAEAYRNLKAMGRVSADYPDTRLVFPLTPDNVQALGEPFITFWTWVAQQFLTGDFQQLMLSQFRAFLEQRWGRTDNLKFQDEALIVQDHSTYALEPHTDTLKKVLSFLFYLPADDSMSHLGTSIYAPKDTGFICSKGQHYPFDRFHLVTTMPYLPNALFAFVKTVNSFHGVEPIAAPAVRRDLLLYDIKVQNPPELEQISAMTPGAAASSRFSF